MDQPAQNSNLVDFYLGKSTDTSGRTINDIWGYNNRQLEGIHNFIQWLFPLPERSMFNSSAPLLTDEDIRKFSTEPELKHAVQKSFRLMMNFYGFEITGAGLRPLPEYHFLLRNWLTPGNHNFLRITRILKFLVSVSCYTEALAFFNELEKIYQESKAIVDDSFGFWKKAVSKKS